MLRPSRGHCFFHGGQHPSGGSAIMKKVINKLQCTTSTLWVSLHTVNETPRIHRELLPSSERQGKDPHRGSPRRISHRPSPTQSSMGSFPDAQRQHPRSCRNRHTSTE